MLYHSLYLKFADIFRSSDSHVLHSQSDTSDIRNFAEITVHLLLEVTWIISMVNTDK